MSTGLYNETVGHKLGTLEFQIIKMGDKNAGKLLYYIEAGTEISGLCALLRRTISGLYIADMLGAVPVISWKKSCLLNENRVINGSDNPFEYFFEPISTISTEEASKSRHVIMHEIKNDAYLWGEGRIVCSDGQTERYILLQQNILKKYPIVFKKEIEQQLREEVASLMGNVKAIGVHMRGAQRRRFIKGLANPIPFEWYFDELDKLLSQGQYDCIFVATDDSEYLMKTKDRYGDKVMYFKDTERCTDGMIPYFTSDRSKYRITFETLRDMYALLHCNCLIGGPSNVTMMVRVMKLRYGKWEHCIMMDNGVCTDGEENVENTLKIIRNNGNMDILNQKKE